jgi:hypothetical protein
MSTSAAVVSVPEVPKVKGGRKKDAPVTDVIPPETDSGPVVKSAKKAAAAPKAKKESKPVVDESKAVVEDPKPELVAEVVVEETKIATEPKAKKESKAKKEPKPVVEESKPEPVVDEPKAKTESNAKKEPKAKTESNAKKEPKAKKDTKPVVEEPKSESESDTIVEKKQPAKRGRKPKSDAEKASTPDAEKKPRKPRAKKDPTAEKKPRKGKESTDDKLARIKTESDEAIRIANIALADEKQKRETLEAELAKNKFDEKEVGKVKAKALRDLVKVQSTEPISDDESSKTSKKMPLAKKFAALDANAKTEFIQRLNDTVASSIAQIEAFKSARKDISANLTIAKKTEKKANALIARLQAKLLRDSLKLQPSTTPETSSTLPLDLDHDHDPESDSESDSELDILTRETFIDGQPFLIDQHNNLYHPTNHSFIRSL